MYTVIIPSAGKGQRSKLDINKLLYQIDGIHLIEYTLESFLYDKEFTEIILVVAADELELFRLFSSNKIKLVVGGSTRQESVHRGLLAATNEIVFIHDGARPMVSEKIVQDCKSVMRQAKACVVAIEAVDTIKHYEHGRWSTIDRKDKYLMQTPQCGLRSLLLDSFNQASTEGFVGTDDMEVLAKYSDTPIEFVRGSHQNIKITYPEDFELFRRLKGQRKQ